MEILTMFLNPGFVLISLLSLIFICYLLFIFYLFLKSFMIDRYAKRLLGK